MEVPVPGEYRQGKQQGSRPVDYVDSGTVPVSHPASAVRRWQLDCGYRKPSIRARRDTEGKERAHHRWIKEGAKGGLLGVGCWYLGSTTGITVLPSKTRANRPISAAESSSRERKRYRYVRC